VVSFFALVLFQVFCLTLLVVADKNLRIVWKVVKYFSTITNQMDESAGAVMEALRYKPECHRFDSRWRFFYFLLA
jgi:hypothetical protein